MKVAIALAALIATLGVVYALAFIGVIPVKSLAAKNPIVGKALAAIKLVPKKKAKSPILAASSKSGTSLKGSAAPDPLASQKAQLAAEQAQLAQEKAQLDSKLNSASAAPSPVRRTSITSAKMSAIYDTMKPAEIASLFEKLPDSQVVDALTKMDEDKAGKVLTAMPVKRAAKLTTIINKTTATPLQTAQSGASSPATSLP
jgi:flagellar motility protein MotE (MotC chaperone)